MANNETQVTIKGRTLSVAIDGMSPLEIATIIGKVEKRIDDIAKKTQLADTSKLALYAAVELATELYIIEQRSTDANAAGSRKIEDMIGKLEGVLKEKAP